MFFQLTVPPGDGPGPGGGGGEGGAGGPGDGDGVGGDGPTFAEHIGFCVEPMQMGASPVQQMRADTGTSMVSHATGYASEQHTALVGTHTGYAAVQLAPPAQGVPPAAMASRKEGFSPGYAFFVVVRSRGIFFFVFSFGKTRGMPCTASLISPALLEHWTDPPLIIQIG